jgi:hypothetical protein
MEPGDEYVYLEYFYTIELRLGGGLYDCDVW